MVTVLQVKLLSAQMWSHAQSLLVVESCTMMMVDQSHEIVQFMLLSHVVDIKTYFL